MKKLALALAAMAALTGQALAADMAVKARPVAPPPPPVANWTGCYISGGVGYGLFDHESSGPRDTFDGALLGAPADFGGRGWLAGGGGGCDYQFGFGGGGGIFGTGQWVIGVFADGQWTNMRGNRISAFSTQDIVGDASGRETINSQWAVGGRIGWLMSPNLLTYFSGGYTEANLSGVGNFYAPNGNFFTDTFLAGRTVQGWFLGSGVEYNTGWFPGLTWKTEYRFSEFNRTDRIERNILDGSSTGIFSSDKLFTQTVMTSLVWRFNFGGGYGAPVAAKY
jgi:outer membrane immunogenic protein